MFAYDENSLRPLVLPLNVLACVESFGQVLLVRSWLLVFFYAGGLMDWFEHDKALVICFEGYGFKVC